MRAQTSCLLWGGPCGVRPLANPLQFIASSWQGGLTPFTAVSSIARPLRADASCVSRPPSGMVAAEPREKTREAPMTFSIIAHDESTGQVGIAVASKTFATGARVPFIRTGVGAIASQAKGNQLYGP